MFAHKLMLAACRYLATPGRTGHTFPSHWVPCRRFGSLSLISPLDIILFLQDGEGRRY